MMRTLDLLVALFAVYMLARHGREALLFVAPGLVRAEADREGPPRTLAQLRAGEELSALGFVRLGVLFERGVLGGLARAWDAWANPVEGFYADVLAEAPSGEAWIELRSLFTDGATVITANHRRLAIEGEAVQAGALPGATVQATVAAHRHATARFARQHGPPQALLDLGSRLAAAQRWQRGLGRREIRHRYAPRFANACLALLLLAGSVNLMLQRIK